MYSNINRQVKLNNLDLKALSHLLGVKADEEFIFFPNKYRGFKTKARDYMFKYSNRDSYILLGNLLDPNKTKKDKFGNNIVDTNSSNIKYVPAIMLDIDSHSYGLKPNLAELVKDSIVKRFREDYKIDIEPNAILYSGRGLQLFWFINEYDIRRPNIVNLMKDFRDLLVKEVGFMLGEINTFLMDNSINSDLSIDKSTSIKRQLFRAPGFENTISGTVAHFIHFHERKRLEIGRTIKELKKELGIKSSGKKFVKFSKRKSNYNIDTLLQHREEDTLSYLFRNEVGVRHKCFTNLISIKLNQRKNDETIVRELEEVNDKLVNTYYKDIKEIEVDVQRIRTFWDKKTRGNIKVKNSTMVEYLGISDEELSNNEWRTFSSKHKKKSNNDIRDNRIKELFEKNTPIKQIAELCNISRTTVYKVLKDWKGTLIKNRELLLSSVKETSFKSMIWYIEYINYISNIENLNSQKLNTMKYSTIEKYKKIE